MDNNTLFDGICELVSPIDETNTPIDDDDLENIIFENRLNQRDIGPIGDLDDSLPEHDLFGFDPSSDDNVSLPEAIMGLLPPAVLDEFSEDVGIHFGEDVEFDEFDEFDDFQQRTMTFNDDIDEFDD